MSKITSLITSIWKNSILILVILMLISGLVPQLEIFLFGDMVISTIIIKFILVIILLCSIFFSKAATKIIVANKLIYIWYLFLLYLVFDLLFLLKNNEFNQLLIGYNAYYYLILTIPLFLAVQNSISIRRISIILVLLFIPLSILGICQYLLKNPILPVSSPNGKFIVKSIDFVNNGSMRAFSLFDSGLAFGNFLCICLSIFWAYGSTWEKKFITIPLFILSFIAIYMTLTRNVYLITIFSILTVSLLEKINSRNKKFYQSLPFFYLFIGFIINSILSSIKIYSGATLADTTSLLLRQDLWSQAFKLWITDVHSFFFGSGIFQNNNTLDSIVVDNGFLAVILNIGLIGGCIWLLTIYFAWKFMLNILVLNFNYFNLGLCGFFSTVFISNFFNINYNVYIIVLILYILGKGENRYSIRNYRTESEVQESFSKL
ncbi:hypothetical protein BpPP18_24810 [Weizmannia acidilactici]|nr:hypothetical protein BpPP18_24810 [Weizmannia acidilactici]